MYLFSLSLLWKAFHNKDSDVMLDMIQALNPAKNYPFAEIHYVWFNTGIEYTATKEHLGLLEEKYGVTIEQKKAKRPFRWGARPGGNRLCQSR